MLRRIGEWLRRQVPQDDDAMDDERDLPEADLRNPFDGDWLDAHERATGERLRLFGPEPSPAHLGKPDQER